MTDLKFKIENDNLLPPDFCLPSSFFLLPMDIPIEERYSSLAYPMEP
jgi:hypothetical protein